MKILLWSSYVSYDKLLLQTEYFWFSWNESDGKRKHDKEKVIRTKMHVWCSYNRAFHQCISGPPYHIKAQWGPGIHIDKILFEFQTFLFRTIYLKISSANCRPVRLGLGVLIKRGGIVCFWCDRQSFNAFHKHAMYHTCKISCCFLYC